jgi:hypothetical protein
MYLGLTRFISTATSAELDKVEAAYRGDLISACVDESWADYCAKPQTEASVTPIGRPENHQAPGRLMHSRLLSNTPTIWT